MHTASYDDIKAGRVTDVYFERAVQVLESRGADKVVRAEFIAKTLPADWPWAVLAGVEECLELLDGLPVTVRGLPEGSIFRPYQPVLEIEGRYTTFAALETALLGMLCQTSGVATKAARFRKLAGDRTLISFGARRMHPVLAPVVERAAYIGGCDGVATVIAAEQLGIPASGTMPHSLVLLVGSTIEAVRAYHETIPREIPRVALIDTFNDEKFEAIRVAEALGQQLSAVRLDTPASRRGSFRQILEEVRWELDLRGYGHVRLFVSGGLSEAAVDELNEIVDGYGVGTEITAAPVVDFAMDIVEIEGEPMAKRGKMSGSKTVWRCDGCDAEYLTPRGQRPETHAHGEMVELTETLLEQGKLVRELPSPSAIRERVLAAIEEEALELAGHVH